jgi:carbamoyltransferase
VKYILGIQTGHDAAAALVVDGAIVADVAEERLTRVKNDSSFPLNAIDFCLNFAGIRSEELDAIALPNGYLHPSVRIFFDIPRRQLPKENRTIQSRLKQAALQYILNAKRTETTLPIYQKPLKISRDCRILLFDHHQAHAGSAYYTSGLNKERVLVVTMDGIGDLTSVGIWKGEHNRLECLKTWGDDASLGWFYSNCTEALGWRHGCDEWKTMGLAPYGKARPGALDGFHPVFKAGELVKPHKYLNGGAWLDHSAYHYHFDDAYDLEKIAARLGREDFSAETQRVFLEQANEVILPWLDKLGTRHLCAAGGSFLNVKANQEIWYSGKLDTQWVYPNPGDAGLAVGAALCAYYGEHPEQRHRLLEDAYFGPEYSNEEIRQILDDRGIAYEYVEDPSVEAAQCLADNKIIGWFQGRMESGPRALGNRSILMSPLREENKDIINRCVKYREAFRPFCPSLLYEKRDEYLVDSRDERFMVTSFAVHEGKRDRIPAVVHVDGTARPQMVKPESNPRYYDLIKAFGDLTGEHVILNTSFNVKGEPVVCTPREAIRCFYDTGLDLLFLGNYKIAKPRTPQVAVNDG